MSIKYLKPTTLKNKTILLRVDVNVPIDDKTGKVADDFRIASIIPTIRMLQEGNNRIILCGHLGRPEGRDKSLSLKPVAKVLAGHLGYKFLETHHPLPEYPISHLIFYTGNIMADLHADQLKNITAKDIVMLENLRFYKGEEENDKYFARCLARLGDVYVNDAFSVCHRAAASTAVITKLLPSYCGPLLEQEIKSLDVVTHKHKKPFVLLMGGIKISDKAKTLTHLGEKADKILLGGGLSTLIFKAKGMEVGLSKAEDGAERIAFEISKNFKDKLLLPVDVVVADKNMSRDSIRVRTPYEVGKQEMILDVGPKTILMYAEELKAAKTIVWNGPLGYFEAKPFRTATMALARVIGGVAGRKAYAVVGGGETVDAVRQSHQFENIDHVSTGGGAMLEYLAGKKLPGIEALK